MATVQKRVRRIPAMASFVAEIRAAIESQGLTIAEVAEKAKVSRAYVYRVLDGTQTPSMDIADKIAGALGLVIITAPAA